MDAHICDVCGRKYTQASSLRRHLKGNCKPPPTQHYECQQCGNKYANRTSLARHHQRCKSPVAEDDTKSLRSEVNDIKQILRQLSTTIIAQSCAASTPATTIIQNNMLSGQNGAQTNIGSQTNVTTNVTNNHITIQPRPWPQREPLCISVDMLRSAFLTNPRLVEFTHLSAGDIFTAEKAAPYVADVLTELVCRAQAQDPTTWNAYLDPKRADQVLVLDTTWRAIPLVEAIRSLFDEVSAGLRKVSLNNAQQMSLRLPDQLAMPKITSAVSTVPIFYDLDPDKHTRAAARQMSAHFENQRGVIKEGHPPRTFPDGSGLWCALLAQGTPAEQKQLTKPITPYTGPTTPIIPWKPPSTREAGRPLSPRWTSCNAATALELDEPPPGESAKARLERLATEVGISTRHWANKLWDARDEGLISESFQEAAAALIEADQAN